MPRSRARASMPADWSTPATRTPAAASIGKYLPVPHGASSTVAPGPIRRSTRATHSRCTSQGILLIAIGGRLGVVAGHQRRPALRQPHLPLHAAPLPPRARHRAATGTTGRHTQRGQTIVHATATASARPRSPSRPARPGSPPQPKLREPRQISPERGARSGRSARPGHSDLAIGGRRIVGVRRSTATARFTRSSHSVTAVRRHRGGFGDIERSQPTPAIHGLLAATAKARGLILVTFNLAPRSQRSPRAQSPRSARPRQMIHSQPRPAGERWAGPPDDAWG